MFHLWKAIFKNFYYGHTNLWGKYFCDKWVPTSGSNSIPSSEGHTTNTGFIWYTKCEIFHRLNIQVHLALGLMEFAAQKPSLKR